jgi:hypothetical protein
VRHRLICIISFSGARGAGAGAWIKIVSIFVLGVSRHGHGHKVGAILALAPLEKPKNLGIRGAQRAAFAGSVGQGVAASQMPWLVHVQRCG